MLVNKYVCNQINRLRDSRFFSIIDSKRVSEAALGVRKNGRSGEAISEKREGLRLENNSPAVDFKHFSELCWLTHERENSII